MGTLEAIIALATVAASVAAPLTAFVLGRGKQSLLKMQQDHDHRVASRDQDHGITKEYLDRALNPDVPVAIRHQLLRFLSVPDDEKRLQTWALRELARLQSFVETAEAPVNAATKALLEAKTSAEVGAAERDLQLALRKQRRLVGKPRIDVSPEAIRAGLFARRDLSGAVMKGWNLTAANMDECNLSFADLSEATLARASLMMAKLHDVTLEGAKASRVFFQMSDMRNANCRGADFSGAHFEKALVHGANFSGATLPETMPVLYDESTTWPDAYDPKAHGAVFSPMEDLQDVGASAPSEGNEGDADAPTRS